MNKKKPYQHDGHMFSATYGFVFIKHICKGLKIHSYRYTVYIYSALIGYGYRILHDYKSKVAGACRDTENANDTSVHS